MSCARGGFATLACASALGAGLAACDAAERGAAPAAARAGDPGPYLVYVSNEDSNDVSVIDPRVRRVVATHRVGKRPRGLRVDASGERLYVALSGSPKTPPGTDPATVGAPDRAADGIGVVDVASGEIERVLTSGPDPESFDFARGGAALYVSNEDAALASRVDLESGKVVRSVQVGLEPEGVAVHPVDGSVYVSNEADGTVSVLASDGSHVRRTLAVGSRPRGIVFTRDGARAFVMNELGASVTVIDARRHEVVGEISLSDSGSGALPARPMDGAVAPDGRTLYVSNGRAGTVSVVDLTSQRVVRTIRDVGARPWGITLSPDGRVLFTANGPSNDVTILDAQKGRVVARVPAGRSPWGVAIGPVVASR